MEPFGTRESGAILEAISHKQELDCSGQRCMRLIDRNPLDSVEGSLCQRELVCSKDNVKRIIPNAFEDTAEDSSVKKPLLEIPNSSSTRNGSVEISEAISLTECSECTFSCF